MDSFPNVLKYLKAFSCFIFLLNLLYPPLLQNKIGAGRLMGPKGVAVDKNGHIITVDNKACCVFIFQSNGKLVTKFGGRGTSDRQFAGEAATIIEGRPGTTHPLSMTLSVTVTAF